MRTIFLIGSIIFVSFMLQSCNFLKDCDDRIPDIILLPLEIENRNDTISLSDSIVFYSKFYALGYDAESGRHYDLNDLTMIAEFRVTKISDSLPISEFPSPNIDFYFNYKVNIGSEHEVAYFKPYIQNDSMTYKITLYPKESGLFKILMGAGMFEYFERKGIILNEDEKGCKLYLTDGGFIMKPGLNMGINDYNNFDMYYNSGLFHPGPVYDIVEQYEYFKQSFSASYHVYVSE